MAKFEFEQVPDLNDRCFVKIDNRYELAICRTDEGIIIEVWPIDKGEIWDSPYDSFQVFDSDTTVDEEPAETEGAAT